MNEGEEGGEIIVSNELSLADFPTFTFKKINSLGLGRLVVEIVKNEKHIVDEEATQEERTRLAKLKGGDTISIAGGLNYTIDEISRPDDDLSSWTLEISPQLK